MTAAAHIKIKTTRRLRVEDYRLLTGRGRYTDDLVPADAAYMAVVRSMTAAGTIREIETSAARDMPGILGVFTGDDLAADGLGSLRPARKFNRPDGTPMIEPPFEMLTRRAVHCVGDPVAIVVAESAAQAEDAAEHVVVDITDTATVTDVAAAVPDGAPSVWTEVPDNVAFRIRRGDRDAVNDAMTSAAHVTAVTLRINRVSANPIEPRVATGTYDPDLDGYTLTASVQSPFRVRDALATDVFDIAPEKLRVISPDVGGSFGMKNSPFPEYALVLWAARKLGRPVHWTGKRSECFISDCHARDNLTTVRLALDSDGRFLALDVKTLANLGAYLNTATPHSPTGNLGGLAGVYRTPAIAVEVDGVHTHTHSTAPYRGAGRPEATYVMERAIDVAALELGIDRVELRRRNLIRPDEMPFQTGLIFTYDCGAFEALMDQALTTADWAGFEARRADAAARGRLRGIGIANPIEIAGGPMGKPSPEYGAVAMNHDGKLTISLGSHDVGQGHTTSFQILAEQVLGIKPDDAELISGDTGQIAKGTGTFGSRTLGAAGTAFLQAAETMLGEAKTHAAACLGVAGDDIEYDVDEAVFRARDSNATLTWPEVVKAADTALTGEAWVAADNATFPNGCHICEVETDPETGAIEVISYVVVDDVGVVLNPLLVKGQIQGGVAQGLGQALMEDMVYDNDSGQLISGSFQDYAMPRADDLSRIQVFSRPVPTAANRLGTKGVGEAGTVGALPAVVGAVVDSLAPLGIKHVDMPLTPERVWRAIQAADKTPEVEG